MRRSPVVPLLCAILASLVLLAPAHRADAHAPYGTCQGDADCNFYRFHWISDQSVAWRFTAGFPAGTWRARALNAVNAWNALGQPLQWHQVTPDFANFPYDDCSITWPQENA